MSASTPASIADAVGRGDKDAVGDEAHLVGAGDDPLGIGGGEVGGEEQHARAERAVSTIWRAVSCGLSSAGCGPSRSLETHSGCAPARLQSSVTPIVVDGIDVRAGLGAGIDEAALIVGAGDDGGDAHVEVGVGLGLGVHAGIAVDETGDEEFAGAVDDAGVFGNGNLVRQADVGDAAFADDDNGAGNVAGGVTPGGDIDDSAAGKNQRDGRRRGLWLRLDGTEARAQPITSRPGKKWNSRMERRSEEDCRTKTVISGQWVVDRGGGGRAG
jgi:hypothetical protein